MTGQAADDEEQEQKCDQRAADDTDNTAQPVGLTTLLAPAGDALGELTDTDHPHRGRPTTGGQPAPPSSPHRG